MGKLMAILRGMALGAGLMYFFDPEKGDQRKQMVRDEFARFKSKSDETIESTFRDLRIRTRDMLSSGVEKLSEGTESMRQEVRANPLQPEGQRTGEQDQAMWSPTTRVLAGTGAGYLLLYGMARGGIIGTLAQISGIALGAQVLTNKNLGSLANRITEVGGEGRPIHVRKSIQINAPVDQVYNLWSNFENFPRFMKNIDSIRDVGNNRSHWVVKGPVGSKVEFDARMTENRTNEMIAWETLPDAQVKHHGQVKFRENRPQNTQVTVDMSYTPPAGAAGAAVASLFGKDPKSEMDSDLARMKSLLEEGRTTVDNKTVTRDKVMPVTGQDTEGGDSQMEGGSSSGKSGGSKYQRDQGDTPSVTPGEESGGSPLLPSDE